MAAASEGWRRIVVGVELGASGDALSRGSEAALQEVELIATHFGAVVTVLHSTADDEALDENRGEYVRRPYLSEGGRTALEGAVERLRSVSIDARLVVSEEHAVVALVREVVSWKADLLIGAKRAIASDGGRRLGSVARVLLHECPTTVGLVRAARNGGPGCILAAADLSEVGDQVVRSAATIAKAFGSKLHVVHALSMTLDIQMAPPAMRKKELEHATAQAGERISAALDGVPAEIHIGVTSPTQAVLVGVKRLEPDLVVMGTVARHGIQGFVIGNTAERLLHQLDTSLLVVKPESFETQLAL
ncbi:MAG: universal stress protein [Myxococcota bacterium]|nr:universal stress protein [Myxococcota bacterium]